MISPSSPRPDGRSRRTNIGSLERDLPGSDRARPRDGADRRRWSQNVGRLDVVVERNQSVVERFKQGEEEAASASNDQHGMNTSPGPMVQNRPRG